jgi:hypothetical protein
MIPDSFFENCYVCNQPLSAGTEVFMCIPDCSGNTRSVSVPHPTWTNLSGKAVVILDAIQLGGINGLNN